MSSIVTCECGASVRLPESRVNRQFRCPKCKSGIALAVGDLVLVSKQLAPGESGYVCQICHSPVGPDEEYVNCPKCEQVHHRECWSEIGGCGTYGCEQAPAFEKSETSSQAPLTAWGDTKTCPACKEEIKSIAVKCRYCGTQFDTVDPLSLMDLTKKKIAGGAQLRYRNFIVAQFVCSLIGCLAPLTLVSSLISVLAYRQSLAKLGPVFVLMGYVSIGISVLFTMAMVGMFLFELADSQ